MNTGFQRAPPSRLHAVAALLQRQRALDLPAMMRNAVRAR
jgi:hypothetical protein